MKQIKFVPNIENIKKTSGKIKEICKRADAEIAILDELILQLDKEIRDSVLHQYHLNKNNK